MEKINLAEAFGRFADHWKPRILADLNGQQVKVVKFEGPFVWHHHDDGDELFLVIRGRFRMDFHERSVWLEEGEFIVVPRGTPHRPYAEEEVEVLLFEPASMVNTGDVVSELTVRHPERLAGGDPAARSEFPLSEPQ